jgi:hypothetical protein
VLAGLSVPALFLWNNSLKQGDVPQTANSAAAIFTGYNPQGGMWDYRYLKSGLFPVIGGLMIHKLASKLGVNRAMSNAGIPFIRI